MHLNYLCCFCFPKLWECITALATFGLFPVAWYELNKSRNITSAKFAQEFKNNFFNEESRELIMLFEFGLIEYYDDEKGQGELIDLPEDFGFFKVIMEGYKRKDNIPSYLLNHTNVYSCYEIDDILLGHFDDIGFWEKKDIMTLDFIDDIFGHYIKTVWENKEINLYIKDMRKTYNSDEIYENFEYIYHKLESRE